ncbi:hypothetical protein C8Q76DRAFT_744307 [Earliella scabrosa]|nr:hypothetical protein C8Q76DRAFT_744307 [Earliella scabrosa]
MTASCLILIPIAPAVFNSPPILYTQFRSIQDEHACRHIMCVCELRCNVSLSWHWCNASLHAIPLAGLLCITYGCSTVWLIMRDGGSINMVRLVV